MGCHACLNPIGSGISFDCSEEIFHEVWPNAFFLWDLHYKISMGLIPMGYDPTNQTTSIGNFPIGSNPTKILWYSFESKRP